MGHFVIHHEAQGRTMPWPTTERCSSIRVFFLVVDFIANHHTGIVWEDNDEPAQVERAAEREDTIKLRDMIRGWSKEAKFEAHLAREFFKGR